jgi:hypothetical protein
MNDRQRIAILSPIARAHESLNRSYWDMAFCDARQLSTILTVNK